MINLRSTLVALLALAGCAGDATDAPAPLAAPRIDRTDRAGDGVPFLVHGALGRVGAIRTLADVEPELGAILPELARATTIPAEQLVAARVSHDQLGMTHVIYRQTERGLPVVGGGFAVHIAADGTITSLSNGARDASAAPVTPAIAATFAAETARLAVAHGDAEVGAPALVYLIGRDRVVHLAWEVVVTARHAITRDRVYIDATDGTLAAQHAIVMTAKSRTVYDGQGGLYPETSGTEVGTEATPPTDQTAKAAFDNTGATWDCYHDLFQRDSYDGQGGTLQSLVHVAFDYGDGQGDPNNAVWDGSQMVYGDGDGSFMGPTARALDVTAHELTHGVTQETAGLQYQDESGALNEGMSDIMGAVCEAHTHGGVTANTWLVGEDIFTPNTPGDALRYMANPTADAALYPPDFGGSRDYYPERYAGDEDYGGVHLNSGIANLAFELLTVGGPHPRAKTPYTVNGIGIDHAGAIFERALTHGYFMPDTTFAEARAATEQVATELYPGGTKASVSMAWATVGVGAAPIDTAPPTVHITSPMASAAIAAGFAVTADASDDQGILRVDFSVDGTVIGSATTAPYSVTTAATLAPGAHTIEATAYDAVNHASDSVSITVIDPTCGGGCPDDQSCVTGVCTANPDNGGGGGCCQSSRSGAGGPLLLLVGTALVLRRRRRSV